MTGKLNTYFIWKDGLFPSLYEEDYILRSLGSIVTQPDVALTDLVANARDAGASDVTLSIPEENSNF